MQIIAKVVSHDISESDVNREMRCGGTGIQALKRLIDRCLLLEKAAQCGLGVLDEEFDLALLQLLDEEEPFGLPPGSLQDMDASIMENLLKRNILIRKYIASLCQNDSCVQDEKVKELYQEQVDHFCSEEMVRCSHILIKGVNAMQKAKDIRASIHSKEDFLNICTDCSDCPSCENCGDLGFFPRGKLDPVIEEVAFALKLNEISAPFATRHGYHILMLVDRKETTPIPFEEIKDSLANSIRQMEREYFLMRHLSELYEEFKAQIYILSDAYK